MRQFLHCTGKAKKQKIRRSNEVSTDNAESLILPSEVTKQIATDNTEPRIISNIAP